MIAWKPQILNLQVYCATLKLAATCPHYTFTRNFIHDLTFVFPLINADGRNAAVDPPLGSSYSPDPSFSPLSCPAHYRKGLGTKLNAKLNRRLECWCCVIHYTCVGIVMEGTVN